MSTLNCTGCGGELKTGPVRLRQNGDFSHLTCPVPHKQASGDRCNSISEVLRYEVKMLAELALLAPKLKGTPLGNACIEAFAIHLRCLLEYFFKGSRRSATDVVADEFFRARDGWKGERGKKGQYLGEVETRIGKLVAHMTIDRLDITEEAKKWDLDKLRDEAFDLVQRFMSAAPSDRLPASIKAELEAVITEAASPTLPTKPPGSITTNGLI